MWSLGCIVAEMLLERPLFPGTSTINQIERIMATLDAPSPQDVASVCSGSVHRGGSQGGGGVAWGATWVRSLGRVIGSGQQVRDGFQVKSFGCSSGSRITSCCWPRHMIWISVMFGADN